MNLIPFAFDDSTIRVIHEAGVTWFVGRDVAQALGYANPADAMDKHCRGVAKRYTLQTGGGPQELRILSEGDVLRLIVRSRLPSAVRFEAWVMDEVLPQIARTGAYGAPTPSANLADPAALRQLLLSYTERTIALEQQVALQAPRVAALDRISSARGAVCLRDAAKALNMRPSDLIAWMQEHTWIYKRPGTSWKAYQPRIATGLLTQKVITRGEGESERLYDQVLVTPRGLARLAELLEREAA